MVWIESITTRAGGAALAERGQNVAHRGRRGEPQRRRAEPEPARAQPHLVGRLLAGNISDRKALRMHTTRTLSVFTALTPLS